MITEDQKKNRTAAMHLESAMDFLKQAGLAGAGVSKPGISGEIIRLIRRVRVVKESFTSPEPEPVELVTAEAAEGFSL